MLRFIATDLDGTLLDGNRRVPEEIFPLVRELTRRGILFCPASGRQYANLKELFSPVADDVIFMAENGALVRYRGETLYLNPVPKGLIQGALNAVRAIPALFPMLCGCENAYIENDEEPFFTHAKASYTNCVKVNSLNEVIGREEICKIAIYDALGSQNNCIKRLPQKLPLLRTALSGAEWCDVSAIGASKGDAMRFIKKRFALEKSECAAFGDHMNDFEMLTECGHAYVTENAYPPLKELVPNVIPSNRDGGVLLTLKKILASENTL